MKSIPYYFGAPENKALWEKLRPFLEEEHPCIFCGSNEFELWAKEGYLEAKRCLKCEMISVNPHFTREGLRVFYSDYFAHRQKDIIRKQQRDQTYIIDCDWVSLFVRGGKVLDVGCSGGFFLSKFSPRHWDRYGVEISADAAEYARKHFDIPVRIGNVVELDFEDQFDLVMLRGTIEHIRVPMSILKKCSELLRIGGYLFITATPAGDSFAFDVYREKWHLFTPLEHIHFFSVKLLSRILYQYGLELVTHYYQYEETPYATPLEDFKKIRQDICFIGQGHKEKIRTSVPFPGSMITALWKKAK